MLKIVKDTQPSLRERCKPVELPLDEKDQKTLKEMLSYIKKSQDDEYCERHHIRSGIGLAAPQIGVQKQMLVIYYEAEEGKPVEYALVNPKIISSSVKLCYLKGGEGCLSVDDDHKGYVYRAYKIRVKAYSFLDQKEVEIVAKGYDAIVLQHEIDHLSGVLYYDHIDKKNPFVIKDNSIAI